MNLNVVFEGEFINDRPKPNDAFDVPWVRFCYHNALAKQTPTSKPSSGIELGELLVLAGNQKKNSKRNLNEK